MGWLIFCGRHVVEGGQRSRRIYSFHSPLHRLGHLLKDSVSHGSHEILECVHCNVGFPFWRALPDRGGLARELSEAYPTTRVAGMTTIGALSLLERARVTSLTTIIHRSLHRDGAKCISRLSRFSKGDVEWEWSHVMSRTVSLTIRSTSIEPAKRAAPDRDPANISPTIKSVQVLRRAKAKKKCFSRYKSMSDQWSPSPR